MYFGYKYLDISKAHQRRHWHQAVTAKLVELSQMHIPKLESEAGDFKHDADYKELTLFPCKPEAPAATPNAAAIATDCPQGGIGGNKSALRDNNMLLVLSHRLRNQTVPSFSSTEDARTCLLRPVKTT
ncbi:hypothetical protein WJX77_006703 [Trebouxia sp. C0004]